MEPQTNVSHMAPTVSIPAPTPRGVRISNVRRRHAGIARPKRILIVGTDENARRLAMSITESPAKDSQVVGFIGNMASPAPGVSPILGRRADVLKIVDEFAVDEVIVSRQLSWEKQLLEEISGDGHKNLRVTIVPGVYEAMLGVPPLDTVDDIPLVKLGHRGNAGLYGILKPIIDKTIALGALLVTSPILALALLAVKATSKGPAIYKQERVTRGGRIFTLYKVRTMVESAEAETGPRLSSENDERVTRIGAILRATKIDELPQLFNVLNGEMSLVGPRPERPCFVQDYERKIACYRERSRVLAGITGMAQVYGDYLTTPETKLRYDLLYVYNWSLRMDVKIILLTARAILRELLRHEAQHESSEGKDAVSIMRT